MSPIIIARGVSYELANGRELFKRLNFSLDARLTSLVGPNGVGKTCLANILVGHLKPTEGVVHSNGPIKLFSQRAQPEPVTVAEFLSAEYQWSLFGARLLHNIDPDAICTTLSGGQWMRIRLARELGDHFLILDEPTNNLDREGREALLRFLRERRCGALLISHDRECLELCDETIELSNRGLAKFGGGWSAYREAKDREHERLSDALELAKRRRDAAKAKRIEQTSRQEKRNRRGAESAARGGAPKIIVGARKRLAQASTGKIDSDTQARATSTVKEAFDAFHEMKVDPMMYADLVGRELPTQKLVAEVQDLNVRFKDWIYKDDLDFTWRGNVRVSVSGANGSGKSTLLKMLRGGAFETRGQLRRGELVTLYLDQRCSILDDTKTVLENVRSVSSASESDIRDGLARFLFAKDTVFQKVHELSGGERLRAALARCFLSTQKPELLLLDEPTNNLDLINVEFLETIINEFKGALVVVSHDTKFLENCGISQELVVHRR